MLIPINSNIDSFRASPPSPYRQHSPYHKNEIVSRGLELNLAAKVRYKILNNNFKFPWTSFDIHFSQQSLKWGTFHVCLLSVLLFDISNKQPFSSFKWYYAECLVAVLVGLSVIYYFGKYFYLLFTIQPLHGTPQQRDLLQFKEGGEYCLI